jgi:hypothetical protein
MREASQSPCFGARHGRELGVGLRQSTAGVRLHAVGGWAWVTGCGCEMEEEGLS